jgi:hypothetical protein
MSLPSLQKATSAANLRVVSVKVAVADTVIDTTGALVNAKTPDTDGFVIATLPAKAVVTGLQVSSVSGASAATVAVAVGATTVRAAATLAAGVAVSAVTGVAAPMNVQVTVGGGVDVNVDYTVAIQYYIADAADVVL